MKHAVLVLLVGVLVPAARAQVTITADDMFNQPGQYYRAYSNPYDPTSLSPTPWPVPSGLIGSAGPNQFWDFSSGPTNIVYRFDYLLATNVDSSISSNFPQAQMVEQQTDEATQDVQYLFFTQVPGVGRTVYGAYTDIYAGLLDPAEVFTAPIVDFPATITYGMEWTTVAVYTSNVNVNDNTDPTDPFSGSIGLQVTETSDLKADAAGTMILPDDLGGAFAQGLRINESVTIATAMDNGDGTFSPVETDYARNYYWLMPGRGIVASLASTQGSSGAQVDNNFSTATQFWRMFETNKKPNTSTNTTGNGSPAAVSDLRIRYSSGQVLLTWSKANNASQYQVDVSTNLADTASWKPFSGIMTNGFFVLDNVVANQERFYRVVSMK